MRWLPAPLLAVGALLAMAPQAPAQTQDLRVSLHPPDRPAFTGAVGGITMLESEPTSIPQSSFTASTTIGHLNSFRCGQLFGKFNCTRVSGFHGLPGAFCGSVGGFDSFVACPRSYPDRSPFGAAAGSRVHDFSALLRSRRFFLRKADGSFVKQRNGRRATRSVGRELRVDAEATDLLFGSVRAIGDAPIRVVVEGGAAAGSYTVDVREATRGYVVAIDHGRGNRVIGGRAGIISVFRNGQTDEVTCGPRGTEAIVDLRDRITNDSECRSIREAPKDQHPTVEVKGRKIKAKNGRAAVKLKCPKDLNEKRCKGKLVVKKGGKKGGKLGAARYKIKRGKKAKVRVRVGGRRGAARAIAREKGADGRPKTATKQLKLR